MLIWACTIFVWETIPDMNKRACFIIVVNRICFITVTVIVVVTHCAPDSNT